MFGMGMTEIILVLVIALLVIGPKKLPEVAKALGKGFGEFKRAMSEFKEAVNIDIEEDKKQSSNDDLKDVYADKWKNKFEEEQKEDLDDLSAEIEKKDSDIKSDDEKGA